MYLLLISATGGWCVLKDFLGNPVIPLLLGQHFPEPLEKLIRVSG